MRADHPDFGERRDQLLTALRLTPVPAAEAVARLRAAAARTFPDFVPFAAEGDGPPYELLFEGEPPPVS